MVIEYSANRQLNRAHASCYRQTTVSSRAAHLGKWVGVTTIKTRARVHVCMLDRDRGVHSATMHRAARLTMAPHARTIHPMESCSMRTLTALSREPRAELTLMSRRSTQGLPPWHAWTSLHKARIQDPSTIVFCVDARHAGFISACRHGIPGVGSHVKPA